MIVRLTEGDADGAAEIEKQLSGFAAGRETLPGILTFETFMDAALVQPLEIIHGLLHQGSKLMLGGGSKGFKTWVLLDLALSVSTGTPWWGLKTSEAPVLYVNFELQKWSCRNRLRAIMDAKKILAAPNLHTWHLRGFAADLKDLRPQFVARAGQGRYAMIILDPIYKALGERDENSAGDVALLLNEAEAIAVRTGAAVVWGHHFSKGSQADKSALDRVSGSGVWARDPDTLITLTPHEEDGAFVADFVVRNFRPRPSQVVRWRYPCMEVAPGLDPAALKRPGRPRKHAVADLVDLFRNRPGEPLSYSEALKAAGDAGISTTTFKRLLEEAVRAGKVSKSSGVYVLSNGEDAVA